MDVKGEKTQLIHVTPKICQLTLETLRHLAKKFRHVDKQEEPPIRVIDHGFPNEGIGALEDGAPYPHMILKDGRYYHSYRFDQAVCDKAVHSTSVLETIFGPEGDREEAGAYFRIVLGYASPGSSFTSIDSGILSEELHNAFITAALKVYGEEENESARRLSRIYSIYANILLPGQIVALHLDVPEFLGVDRSSCPSWLLVASHCSGLFQSSRVRNVTCVYYPATALGGALAVYPPIQEGADSLKDGRIFSAAMGSAVMMDSDSCFHHSEQARETELVKQIKVPKLPGRCSLEILEKNGNDSGEVVWIVRDDDSGKEIGRYPESQLRISVSCKMHVFGSDEEVMEFENAQDKALTGSAVIERLTEDLRSRGRLPREELPFYDLGPILVDEYVVPRAPSSSSVQKLWMAHYKMESEIQ